MSYSSILEAIKSASEVTPDKICLGDKKNKVTYKQFWKMINKGASFLDSWNYGFCWNRLFPW